MRHNEQFELIDSTPLGLFSARENEDWEAILQPAKCKCCGKEIEIVQERHRGYCSTKCKNSALPVMVPVGPQYQCLHCGKQSYDEFCSPTCRTARKQFIKSLDGITPAEAQAVREAKQAEEEAGRGDREIERERRQLGHGGKCLQCGRKSEKMFCTAGCRTKWKSSMNAFSRRLQSTACADEAVELF